MIFKEMLELAYILMFDASMNLDLWHQLLLGSSFGEWSFLNEFTGKNRLSFITNEFIAFCESSFAKEFSFVIESASNRAVSLFKFLFHYCALGLAAVFHFKFFNLKFTDSK